MNKLNKDFSIDCMKFQYGGGMERYTIDLVNGFNQIGIKPIVYSTKFDLNLVENQFIEAEKVNLTLIPKPLRQLLLSCLFNKNGKENGKDVISMTTIYTKADIVFCGGNHSGYLNTVGKKKNISDKLKIKNEKTSLSYAKLIIAHSEMMKNELVKHYYVDKNKILVLYPPVDTKKFSQPTDNKRAELRKKFGFNDNEIIYLFPSTGHVRKGFDILKNYFEKSDLPIRLVVAGTPVRDAKNITSLGFVKNMSDLYQAADYTIMASIYEPFGLVGIESVLSGTQVIFSDNMGCLEVLKNNFGYTFSRNNNGDLDSVIRKSFEKAKLFKHRILNPLDCIDYNPALSAHITELMNCIERL